MSKQRQHLDRSPVGGNVNQANTINNFSSPVAMNYASLDQQVPIAAHDPFPPVTNLFGRATEYDDLKKALAFRKPLIIQLVGRTGIGKTALAASVISELNLNYRRLELHSESALKVAERLYEILTKKPAPAKSHTEIISMFIDAWRSEHCLLVIDNLHCLLGPDAKPKDEAADLLLEKLGSAGEQLLTLGWPGTDTLGTNPSIVTKYPLNGIDAEAGIAKLREAGIQGAPQKMSLEQVVATLDGNPKMLEILAILIHKYGGHAEILDRNPDWVLRAASPLDAMWKELSKDQQRALAFLSILRNGRDAHRMARLLAKKESSSFGILESLVDWQLVNVQAETNEFIIAHDIIKIHVLEQLSSSKRSELLVRVQDSWLWEANEMKMMHAELTQREHLQPFLEACYYMNLRGDGDAVIDLLWSTHGDSSIFDILTRLGIWVEILDLVSNAADKIQSHTKHGLCRLTLGISFRLLGEWKKSLAELQLCKDYFESTKKDFLLLQVYEAIGNTYQEIKEYVMAGQMYEQSERIARDLKFVQAATMIHLNILCLKVESKNDADAAMREIEELIATSERKKYFDVVRVGYHQLGMYLQQRKDYKRAIAVLKSSLKMSEQRFDIPGQAISNGQLARLYFDIPDYQKAFLHGVSALFICVNIQDYRRAGVAMADLAKLRRAWGGDSFDKAWRDETKQEVPPSITQLSERDPNGTSDIGSDSTIQ